MWLVMIGAIVSRINAMLALRINAVISFLVFSIFAWFGGTLTSRIVFSTLSHLVLLRYSIMHFVEGIGFILESQVGYKRIKVQCSAIFLCHFVSDWMTGSISISSASARASVLFSHNIIPLLTGVFITPRTV